MGTPYRHNQVCPRCGASLLKTRLSNTMLHVCDTCRGVWLDHQSTTRIVEALEADVTAVLERLTGPAETKVDASTGGLPCPDCGHTLAVRRFFPGNVTVDICRDHGIWFDAHELQKMSRAADRHRRSKSRKLRDGAAEPSQDSSTTDNSGAARAAGLASGIQWLFSSAAALLKVEGSPEPTPESPGRNDWAPTARRPKKRKARPEPSPESPSRDQWTPTARRPNR